MVLAAPTSRRSAAARSLMDSAQAWRETRLDASHSSQASIGPGVHGWGGYARTEDTGVFLTAHEVRKLRQSTHAQWRVQNRLPKKWTPHHQKDGGKSRKESMKELATYEKEGTERGGKNKKKKRKPKQKKSRGKKKEKVDIRGGRGDKQSSKSRRRECASCCREEAHGGWPWSRSAPPTLD